MTSGKESYLDGDSYFDDPNQEHGCTRFPNEKVRLDESERVYPCRVYDRDGKLLRIEYPNLREGKRWTSRY